MSIESDSFVRWQSVTREHFTVTSNVVLGLATGLLAFISERLLSNTPPTCLVTLLGGLAILLLMLSIGLALWCSINRLRDFRATARIARCRNNKEPISLEERLETKILGDRSWLLFWWQLTFFGFGVIASTVALLVRSWS